GNLASHRRLHTKKTYSCEICNKVFYVKKYVVRHMRVHTKEKPYSCEICNKNFPEKYNLVIHMRVTQKRNHICDICNKVFSDKSTQIKHMRVHMNEKPYSCEFCNKNFALKRDLVKHMRVYTKDKPLSQTILDNKSYLSLICVVYVILHMETKKFSGHKGKNTRFSRERAPNPPSGLVPPLLRSHPAASFYAQTGLRVTLTSVCIAPPAQNPKPSSRSASAMSPPRRYGGLTSSFFHHGPRIIFLARGPVMVSFRAWPQILSLPRISPGETSAGFLLQSTA
ncbi:zinc finger protein 83-like, partial [Penaeus monodon]|uniref:zinc finger protein 83-like n=1 Tax=Penaeus monodon TaxID=6687 RepID=UPI0018A76059